MNLTKINESGSLVEKPLLKFQQLELNQLYPLHNLKVVNSKFGDVVRAELSDSVVFLPSRMTTPIKDSLAEFIPLKYGLKFLGMKVVSGLSPTPIVEITEICKYN